MKLNFSRVGCVTRRGSWLFVKEAEERPPRGLEPIVVIISRSRVIVSCAERLRSHRVEHGSGCWLWTGCCGASGVVSRCCYCLVHLKVQNRNEQSQWALTCRWRFFMAVQEVGHRKTYRVARSGRGVPIEEITVVEVGTVFVGPVRGSGLN